MICRVRSMTRSIRRVVRLRWFLTCRLASRGPRPAGDQLSMIVVRVTGRGDLAQGREPLSSPTGLNAVLELLTTHGDSATTPVPVATWGVLPPGDCRRRAESADGAGPTAPGRRRAVRPADETAAVRKPMADKQADRQTGGQADRHRRPVTRAVAASAVRAAPTVGRPPGHGCGGGGWIPIRSGCRSSNRAPDRTVRRDQTAGAG
jgi:hypothetical protein